MFFMRNNNHKQPLTQCIAGKFIIKSWKTLRYCVTNDILSLKRMFRFHLLVKLRGFLYGKG